MTTVRARWAPLAAGIGLVGAGSLVALQPDAANAVLDGPILLRAILAAFAGVRGLWLLLLAAGTLAGDSDEAPGREATATPRTFATMIRGIRLAFLAIATFSAAAGFLLGHLLPIVVGLIIAGVDIVETALLLLVAGTHHGDDAAA